MSSTPKDLLAGPQCRREAVGGANTASKGLGIKSHRAAEKCGNVQTREKRPLPCDSKACLTKNRAGVQLCHREGPMGITKRPM